MLVSRFSSRTMCEPSLSRNSFTVPEVECSWLISSPTATVTGSTGPEGGSPSGVTGSLPDLPTGSEAVASGRAS